jgi:DUF177 domain-containing protein
MLRVDLARLGREGKLQIEGTIEPDEIHIPDAGFRLLEPLEASLVADSAGSGEVVVRGELRGRIGQECRRCLTAVEKELVVELTLVFGPADDLAEDDGEIRVIEPVEQSIDLLPHIGEELLLTVPQYAECKTECRGICPGCGINLNEDDCRCGDEDPDPRWDALRALNKE